MTEEAPAPSTAAAEPAAATVRIAVPAETAEGETRVAATPKSVRTLIQAGAAITVQRGAGTASFIADSDFEAAGAKIAADLEATLDGADLVLVVRVTPELIAALQKGAAVAGMLDPRGSGADDVAALAKRGVTVFALELLPRITRAQDMDALSSMANISGYHAVLRAAEHAPRMFPLLMTAAGTISPARVLVLGAGVAGLQAIATANRLGAVVEGYDVRPEVAEQVESLGAKFVSPSTTASGEGGYAKELGEDAAKKERELLARHVAGSDVVITTAQVPGKRAPLLVTKEMVAGMKPGSLIVDLAGASGGNVEGTKAGERVTVDGVTIDGPLNLPARVPVHASQMYSHNLQRFTQHLLGKEGKLTVDLTDEITGATCVAHDGSVREGGPAPKPAPAPAPDPAEAAKP
jgi:NAD(P) transhydrogenase subunit alpha